MFLEHSLGYHDECADFDAEILERKKKFDLDCLAQLQEEIDNLDAL